MTTSNNYLVRLIQHYSTDYWSTVVLRNEVLRRPLGLHFTSQQLAAEAEQYLFATYNMRGDLSACLILQKDNTDPYSLQMRQVAVAAPLQGQGIGKQMVIFVENWAKERGYRHIFCHARDTAQAFYKQLGYQTVGDGFIEVGIPHYLMEKHC